jgi:hypothetical protein
MLSWRGLQILLIIIIIIIIQEIPGVTEENYTVFKPSFLPRTFWIQNLNVSLS